MDVRWAVKHINDVLDKEVKAGNKKFVIYPYGELGRLADKVMKELYSLEPIYVVDNKIYDGKRVLSVEQVKDRNNEELRFLICNANPESYEEVRKIIYSAVGSEQIVDVFQKNEFSFPSRDAVLKKLDELDLLVKNMGI